MQPIAFMKILKLLNNSSGSHKYELKWVTSNAGFPHCNVVRDDEETKESKWLLGKSSTNHEYSPDELSFLSVLFTVVKVLYLQGSFAILPELINVIEPLR